MLALKSIYDRQLEIATLFKKRRLLLDITREGLAKRSGVSLGSLKRFEQTGEISLKSLLKLALVVERLDDFDQLFKERENISSIDELLAKKNERQRGTKH